MDICFPGQRPNCSEFKIFFKYGDTFLFIALVKILYATSHNEMGLKFAGLDWSESFFGINTTFISFKNLKGDFSMSIS